MNRRAIALAAAVTVVLIAAVWAISGPDSARLRPRSGRYETDVAGGRALAKRACQRLEEFVDVVNRNQSAPKALDLLDQFDAAAAQAYARDVAWVRLLSAAKALQSGVRDDDAERTGIGLDLARTECRPLTSE